MSKLLIKKTVAPVEINVQLGKTVQEVQYEPFSVQVSMKSSILPNEVSSEFHRIYELLDTEITNVMKARGIKV